MWFKNIIHTHLPTPKTQKLSFKEPNGLINYLVDIA